MNPATALTVGIVAGLFGLNALASAMAKAKKPQLVGDAGGKAAERELPEKRVGGGDPVGGDLRPDREARDGAAEHLRVSTLTVVKDAKTGRFAKRPQQPQPQTEPQTA